MKAEGRGTHFGGENRLGEMKLNHVCCCVPIPSTLPPPASAGQAEKARSLPLREPPRALAPALRCRLQLRQPREIFRRIPAIVERRAGAVDASEPVLGQQLVQVASVCGDDDDVVSPKLRATQGAAPARPDGERCGKLLCGERGGFVGQFDGLLFGDAEIRGLLGDPVALRGFRLGRVHEIQPRHNLRRFAASQDVEAVAIIPAVGLPSAAVDALPRLSCWCLFRRRCCLRCFGWRFLGFGGSQLGQGGFRWRRWRRPARGREVASPEEIKRYHGEHAQRGAERSGRSRHCGEASACERRPASIDSAPASLPASRP